MNLRLIKRSLTLNYHKLVVLIKNIIDMLCENNKHIKILHLKKESNQDVEFMIKLNVFF